MDTIRRNRSQAFLSTKQFDDALLDLSYPSTKPDESHNEKALYRIVQALYALRRFSECSEVLECLCKRNPTNKVGRDLQIEVLARLREENKADYNFTAMQANAKKLKPPMLDHATFQGQVEVRNSQIGGRGLFTTTAVKVGDLLLCEKAFAFSFRDPDNPSRPGCSRTAVLISATSNYTKIGTEADLINIIVQKLSKNSSLAQRFTSLYHGVYSPVPSMRVDGQNVVDSWVSLRFGLFFC